MTAAQIVVTVLAIALSGALVWFFFRPRATQDAVVHDGVQEVRIVVKGGYTPSVVQVRTGVPLRIFFDRQEDGECSSRVVFPDLTQSEIGRAHV